MKQSAQFLLDKLAISGSVLCVLHCAALPIILAIFPALMIAPLDNPEFHEMLIWLVIPTSLFAVTLGCRRHKDTIVLLLVGIGLGILTITAIIGHDHLGELTEKITTIIGSIILAYGHWRNYSLCRHDGCNH